MLQILLVASILLVKEVTVVNLAHLVTNVVVERPAMKDNVVHNVLRMKSVVKDSYVNEVFAL